MRSTIAALSRQCFEDCESERPSVTCSRLREVGQCASKVYPHYRRYQSGLQRSCPHNRRCFRTNSVGRPGAMTRTVSWPMQFQWVWKLSFLKKEPQRITRIRQISLYTAPSGLEVFSSLETLKSHCHSLRKNFKCFSRCGTGSLYRCLDCCSILLL